ncbi:zinc finger protein 425 isoform X2 [Bicyclus anynana]|nr:zinc finger protein 425 isoform X2 [Bicyclus anynana]XP_052738641.1 zinc finger protein 425 isoform X2 [Bicyclus anynana]
MDNEKGIIFDVTVMKQELLDEDLIVTYGNVYDSFLDVKEELISEEFCDNNVFNSSALTVLCLKEETAELEGLQDLPEPQQTQLLNDDVSTSTDIPTKSDYSDTVISFPEHCIGAPLLKDHTKSKSTNICETTLTGKKQKRRRKELNKSKTNIHKKCDTLEPHNTNDTLVPHNTNLELLFCEHCSFNSVCKANLKRHITKHSKEREDIICKICMKKFTLRGNLLRHMKIHSGVKPFSCDICGFKVRWKYRLDNHMKSHIGKKRDKHFSCNICKKKFTTKSNLMTHIRKHSGKKPFSCEICGKRYLTKDSLVVHMRVHTGIKPFSCHVCSYTCRYHSSIAKHMLKH